MAMGTCAIDTAFGPVTLEYDPSRALLTRLVLPRSRTALTANGPPDVAPAWVRELAAQVQRYLAGGVLVLPLAHLNLAACTPFRRRVYVACHAIPFGQTLTYGQLAAAAGSPRAARAVGRCLARNPWPLIVPCHRVLGTDGLHGFTGGLRLKQRLLTLEQRAARPG